MTDQTQAPTAAPTYEEQLHDAAEVLAALDVGLGLSARIAAVQLQCPVLPQDKTANVTSDRANYSYTYTSKGVAWHAARTLFGAAGVAILVTEDVDLPPVKDGTLTTSRFVLKLSRGAEHETIARSGQGTDQFDKGMNKAATAAVRTALLDLLGQGGEIDPEQSAVEHRSRGEAGASGAEDEFSDPRPATENMVNATYYRAKEAGVVDESGDTDWSLVCRIATATIDGRIPILGKAGLNDLTRGELRRVWQQLEQRKADPERDQADLERWEAEARARQAPATASAPAQTPAPSPAAPASQEALAAARQEAGAAPAALPDLPADCAPYKAIIEQLWALDQRNWPELFRRKALLADWFGKSLGELTPAEQATNAARWQAVVDNMTAKAKEFQAAVEGGAS